MIPTIEIENNVRLEQLLMTNPDMTKKVTNIIRKVIKQDRKEMYPKAAAKLGSDPRNAAVAIRSSVYRAVLGGNINVHNPRHANGRKSSYQPPRTLRPGQVGGNRRTRSQRTEQIDSYWGMDRAFILRWQEEGTEERTTRYGSRGAIMPRPWFQQAAGYVMEKASKEFVEYMDKLIEKELNA